MTDDSVARRAGFREGDQIRSINSRNIAGQRDFFRWFVVSGSSPIAVAVWRDGRERTIYVQPSVLRDLYDNDSSSSQKGYLGVVLDERYTREAVVWRVNDDSPAEHAGLESGDAIVSIDGQRVRSPFDLGEIVGQMSPGSEAKLRVERDGEMMDMNAVLGSR